jgi:hypothetical protein
LTTGRTNPTSSSHICSNHGKGFTQPGSHGLTFMYTLRVVLLSLYYIYIQKRDFPSLVSKLKAKRLISLDVVGTRDYYYIKVMQCMRSCHLYADASCIRSSNIPGMPDVILLAIKLHSGLSECIPQYQTLLPRPTTLHLSPERPLPHISWVHSAF